VNELPEGFELHEWKPDEVTLFWDFISKTQPDAYFSHRVGKNVAWHFRELLKGGASVVDYGCGTGRFLEEVVSYDCRGAGFDTSSASRQVASERLLRRPNFDGVFGEDELVKQTGAFDVAFCLEVVEHLYDDALAHALEDLHQLLRPGGILVVSTPDDEDLSKNWICNPTTGTVFHRWQHVRSWTAQTLASRLERAGFRTVSTASVHAEALGRDLRSIAMRAGFATVRRNVDRTLFVVAERLSSG
jgi:2-polyprenyl-3-methyl-5-hydroxy-6-metoxy-1,4-benzoquinol methylase